MSRDDRPAVLAVAGLVRLAPEPEHFPVTDFTAHQGDDVEGERHDERHERDGQPIPRRSDTPLDRVDGIADLIDRRLMSHPAGVANPEWFALAERAATTLGELYQRVGAAHLDAEPVPPEPAA